MSNSKSLFLSAMLISATSLSSGASAQTDTSASDTITAEQAAHPDVSVHVKTTTSYDENGNPLPAVTRTRTKVIPTPVVTEQGAPDVQPVDPANYPPQTDANSQLVYLSGGVGESEIAYFKTLKGDYTFKLLMADKEGALVSGATVTITNAKTKSVATLSNVGPYLLVKLPAGKYSIAVQADSGAVTRNVIIKTGKLTVVDAHFNQ